MRIGCLAWGSLLWDPRTLPTSGCFRADGPRLPIEFSRVALDGRVTLVIDPDAASIQTYWVRLDVNSVEEAVAGLGVREKIAPEKWSDWIGSLESVDPREIAESTGVGVRRMISDWRVHQGLDAVVWTALPPRTPAGELVRPNCEDLVVHLQLLDGEARRRAEEYIRRAPAAVQTLNRSRFELELGQAFMREENGD
jgi:hypothetical protein